MLLPFDRPDDPAPPIPIELAVSRGKRVVNRPVKFLLWGGLILGLAGLQRSYWFALALPLGWILGWCWWSFAAPRWRIWAIGRGAHPRALQWYAEKANLLWPKGHWGERTEFGSRAVRQSLQPDEPYSPDTELARAKWSLAPGFFGPPSNQAFLLGVVYWIVAMPAGMSVLNLFREHPTPIVESWFLGLHMAIIFAAMTYARASWRAAVNPAHACGLGFLGFLLMIAMSLRGKAPWSILLIVLGLLLLIAPSYLMVKSALEWRNRQGRLGE